MARNKGQLLVPSSRMSVSQSLHIERVQYVLENFPGHQEATASGYHVFDFIESLEQTHLHRPISFGLIQGTPMHGRPLPETFFRQQDAYRERCLAVRGHIEDEFLGWGVWIARQSGALADEIVLVHISLAAGVGLHAAQGHDEILASRRRFTAVSELTGE